MFFKYTGITAGSVFSYSLDLMIDKIIYVPPPTKDIVIEKSIQPKKIKMQESKEEADKFLSMFENIDSENSNSSSSDKGSLDFGDLNFEETFMEDKASVLSEKQLDSYNSPDSKDGDFADLENLGISESKATSIQDKDIDKKKIKCLQ